MLTATDRVLRTAKVDVRGRGPTIGFDPLTWRKIEGGINCPVFALFEPDTLEFEVGIEGLNAQPGTAWFFPRMTPLPPEAIMACYENVLDEMGKVARRRKQSLKLRAMLTRESIPAEAWERIEKAKTEYRHVYIMVEVDKWQLNRQAVLPTDPLVVAVEGNRMRVLYQFQLKPQEHAALES